MPQKKNYKIRTGARAASKSQERSLIKKAKYLQDHPEVVVPRCEGKCFMCPFSKARKQVQEASYAKNNPAKLDRMSTQGDPIARAYAATLLLVHQEKAPFLARFKTGKGEIAFAVRGQVKREKLIGVQYYDDPMWKMLAVLDVVKKKKLHIYSLNEGMVCTGKEPSPPKDFLDEAVGSMKVNYSRKKKGGKTIFTCPHITPDNLKDDSFSTPYLKVDWTPADTVFAVCIECGKNHKSHTFLDLTERLAHPDLRSEFKFHVYSRPKVPKKYDISEATFDFEVDEKLIEKYIMGAIRDRDLIELHQKEMVNYYEDERGTYYIVNGKYLGNDKKAFMAILKPQPYEKKVLKMMLDKCDHPIIVDKPTPSLVMALFWEDMGLEALEMTSKDKKYAARIFKKADITKVPPAKIIYEAYVHYKEKTILKDLPRYKRLPPVAEFSDKVTRIYKTQGVDPTVRYIGKHHTHDTKAKAIGYAFLLAMGSEVSKGWQFAEHERDFAEYLKYFAEKMLKSDKDDYHANLQDLLSAAASGERLPDPDK